MRISGSMMITQGAAYDEESEGIWLSDRFAGANEINVGDTMTFTYMGFEVSGEISGLAKCGELMICTADENQLMPDFKSFGFAYISPAKLKKLLFGREFYPQINVRSGMEKAELEQAAPE